MDRNQLVQKLLRSREPSVRWKTRVGVLGDDADSRAIRLLREEIRLAPRSRRLVKEHLRPGRGVPWGVYRKWVGAHWSLASLADLGYPAGDPALRKDIDRSLETWLRPSYFREWRPQTEEQASSRMDAVPCLRGRYRRCASQQGNALFYVTRLGDYPEECERLAERLRHWQWPDGGWNCDRSPTADTSSFMETLTPTAGLWEYGTAFRNTEAREAAERASEVFLRRHLYLRVTDGKIIHKDFTHLHYPLYYHYDVLGGLRVLGAMGRLADPRCKEALDLVVSKELPSGGWRADRRFFDLPGERPRKGSERVLWGDAGPTRNEWTTVHALTVLRQSGRFTPVR